jgi:hypothetical protein
MAKGCGFSLHTFARLPYLGHYVLASESCIGFRCMLASGAWCIVVHRTYIISIDGSKIIVRTSGSI